MATKIIYTDETIRIKSVKVGTPIRRVSAGSFNITNLGGVDVTATESDGSILAYKSSTGNYEVTNLRGDNNVTVTYDSATSEYTFGFTNGTFTGSLIPDSNEAYDLGSPTNKFRDLFLSGNSITLGTLDLKDSNGNLVVIDSDGNKINLNISLQSNNTNIMSFDSGSGSFTFNDSDIARTDIDETFHKNLTVASGLTADSATLGGINLSGNNLTTTGKLYYANIFDNEIDLPEASDYHGMFAHVHATGRAYFAHAGRWAKLIDSDTTDTQQVYNLKSNNADIETIEFTNIGTNATSAIRNTLSSSEDLTYDSASGQFSIANTGVFSGTYGSATQVPQLTINAKGQIDSAGLITIAGVTGVDFDSATGTITVQTTGGDFSDVITLDPYTTSNLIEGSNLYYTDDRFDVRLATKTTTDVTEGSNLYYTTVRSDSDFDVRLSDKSTSDLVEGSNLYYTTIRTDSDIDAAFDAKSTSDLSEGSNLYYTIARADSDARYSISVNDLGGDGSLTYTPSTGVITYTGPSASEVRAHLVAGTGVTYDSVNGTISIGQPVATNSNVTFNDVVISGNLTVSGTETTVNTETINLADNEIVLNSNFDSGTPTENGGISIRRGDELNKTLLWNETDDKWTVGSETFVAATFEGNLTGNVTGTVSDISNHNTGDLTEGSNLYYTTARSDSDFDIRLATKTTTNLIEGDNLYYTRVRFDSALGDATSIQSIRGYISTTGDLSYNSSTGQISFTQRTDQEVRNLFSAGGDLSYDSATGAFSIDVEDVYTKTNFDSDLGAALDGGTGITYDSSTDTISITNTGVVAGTYGSATQIPVFTVNAQGQLDSAGSVAVAGVTSLTFDSATGNISIGTADGATFVTTATLDPYTTSNLIEGTNLYYTTARADSDFDVRLATKSTTDVSEGTNLYYTTARADSDAKASLLVNDTGGDGSLSYDSATGVFTYTGPSSSEVRAHFSAGGDMTYDSSTGRFSIDVEQIYSQANFDSDFLTRLQTQIDSASFNTLTAQFIHTDSASFDSATITNLASTQLTGSQATFDSATITNIRFDNVDAQTTTTIRNLFSASGDLSYDSAAGQFSFDVESVYTKANFDSDLGDANTGQLPEGSNLYYTTARADSDFDARLATKTTTDVTEGSNLYYTETRFNSDLSTSIAGGTGITWDSATYNISITDTGVTAGTYGSATGIPVFTVNAQGQLDSARTVPVASVSNVSYDSASYTLTVSTADGGSYPTFLRTVSNVVAGTYGSATQIPVITVDAFGEVDLVSTVNVAGVTSTAYDSATGVFTINTADGGTFNTKLDPQYLNVDSAKITTLNNSTANITNASIDSATITNIANTTMTGQNATFDSAQITNVSTSTLAATTSLTLGSTLAYSQNFGSLSFNQDNFYGDSQNTVFMFASQDSSNTSSSIAIGVKNQFQTVLGGVGTADSNQFVVGFPNANWKLQVKKNVGNTPYALDAGTTLFNMDSNGDIKLSSTTNSISRTTGSLVLAGGLGVGGNLRGNDIFSAGNMQAAGAFIGNLTGQVSTLSNHTTTGLAEGSNLYYTQARFDAAFTGKSTTNLSEGSNLYYTTARADSDAKNAISVNDAGGDGSLSYSAATGIITYNGPSATEVRAHLVAGTGVGYDSATGIISVGQPIGTGDSVQFSGATIGGNLTITGDLNVIGAQNITSQNDLRITNAIIKVADSNAQDIYDIGVVGRYGDDSGTIRRAGFVRDATNGEWYVFTNLIQDGLDSSVPDQTINFNDPSFELGTFNFGALRGSYLGFDSDFRVFSTNYSVVTSNTTASSSQRIAVDTSGGSFTVTLPASPVTGDYVKIIDVGNWSDTSLFIGRNGSTIEGYSDDFELDIGQNVVEFIYINSTWNIYTSIGQRGETGPAGAAADSANFASTNEAIAFAVALG